MQTAKSTSRHATTRLALTFGLTMQTPEQKKVFCSSFSAQWERYYAPTIYDNTIYIDGGTYGGMYSFDGSTGQQKWFAGMAQDDNWTPAVDANYAYVYSGHALTVVNRSTGVVAFTINDTGNSYSDCATIALGTHSDALTIVENRLLCFDLQNKNIKWQLARSFTSTAVTVANGVVYIIEGGRLDAIDELTGSLLWSWTPPSGSLSGNVIATNTQVFASTSTATYAISLSSHASTWSYALSGQLALSNRALYIANSNGTLTAIGFSKSAITTVPPSSLSMSITDPTSDPTYVCKTTSISVSGTANELDSSGGVLCTGNLASVTWVNDRGGSGAGFYDNMWNKPTAWSASGIVLKPGDNVITITATDLWGNSATASITATAPSGLAMAITSPTSGPTYVTNTTPITLSGTANGITSSGTVLGNASLASLTWSNNRGGSGTGTYSGSSTTPTTWSITGIVLKPGDNVISLAATDLWGNSATATITVTAPTGLSVAVTSPTSASTYTTNATPVALSGTANGIIQSGTVLGNAGLASITWSNSRGGSGTGTYSSSSTTPTTWSITGIALQGGDNVITVTATDVWGTTATDVITVTWSPGSIGTAKKQPTGTLVHVNNAVVTATGLVSGSVFVESKDRSSGIRLVTNQALSVGSEVSFTGTLGRVNGEYQIGSVNFLTNDSGSALKPIFLNSNWVGNDKGESLNYVGLNTTGMLVKTTGKVTGTITSQQFFYINDGGAYQDGVGPVLGLRVHVPSGVTIPRTGKYVIVTGISRVEKITLTAWGLVNGDWYPSGTALYVPSIWARNASDIQVLATAP